MTLSRLGEITKEGPEHVRSRLTLAGLALIVAVMLGTMSAAGFVHAAESGGAGRSASEIRLRAGAEGTFSESLVNLMPGDALTRTILVVNDGGEPLRYSLSIATDDPDGKRLGDVLAVSVTIANSANGPDSAEAGACGQLDGRAFDAGRPADDGGFGDPDPGADPGDRSLAPGAAEVLCLRITLPLTADNAYQGARTTASFTLTAEQTKNNP